MNQDLSALLRHLLLGSDGVPPVSGLDVSHLTGRPEAELIRRAAERLCAPTDTADGGTDRPIDDTPTAAFLQTAVARTRAELSARIAGDSRFAAAVARTAAALAQNDSPRWNATTREALWNVFFPEGTGLVDRRETETAALRSKRRVAIDSTNPEPLTDPAREILFTSNVLITVPGDASVVDHLAVPPDLRNRIRATMDEPQVYYYDHPIHIGVDTLSNEAIYGMRGLNDAIAWEKERGRVADDARVAVVLSLSVTHQGLHTVARDYLEAEFAAGGPFPHLDIYLFTELECRRIVEEVLVPYLEAPGDNPRPDPTAEVLAVFGVDGEYGRHYSFLKAIAAFWHVCVDPTVRATFKIDLDQVFPQDHLLAESGQSALDHFRTPLWGARGRDTDGTPVELGMIAGALVNEKDIHRGLFTPDVPFPETIPAGEACVFYNKVPMALSTEAEMMTRYDGTGAEGEVDGATGCTQRYHVTGGTNGILVDSLRRYRPFTPTFVGRAEDQAYILSVLYAADDGGHCLRYVHKPGLIMRHDKEAFAGESIRAATHGRFVGDLARTWIYSTYADALPWGRVRTKEQIDPFTGCFATPIPASIMTLRLLLYCANLLQNEDGAAEVAIVLDVARRKLLPLWEDEGAIATGYHRQRRAWKRYYDALDRIAAATPTGGEEVDGGAAVAAGPRDAARRIVADARIGPQER